MTTSPSSRGAAVVHGAALTGPGAQVIQVQATVSTSAPGFAIIGVLATAPGTCATGSGSRSSTAVPWTSADITVSLGPASLFRRGCGLDLPIAVAILAAAGTIPARAATGHVFAAEVVLDGRLRPVSGIGPAVAAAAAHSERVTSVVAPQNWPEPAALSGITIVPGASLREVVGWLRDEHPPPSVLPAPAGRTPGPAGQENLSLSGLGVPAMLRQVLEASAAGGHHLCLTGPPGAGIPTWRPGWSPCCPTWRGGRRPR